MCGPCGRRMTQFNSLSSSGVSSCYSEMDLDRYNEEDSDQEDAFISFTTPESKCERLYEQGLELKHQGDLHESLSSFLKCLEGMQECQYFAKLPQTLHQLSDLYRSLQHVGRAEDYSKAERLFYEATTIEPKESGALKQMAKRRPFSKKPKQVSSMCNPAEYCNLLSKKAEEFERLAGVCAEECKFDLAKEYCSKAASIRHTVLGQGGDQSSIWTCSGDSAMWPEGGNPQDGDVHTCLQAQQTRILNGSSQSALCEGAQTDLSANEPTVQSQYPTNSEAHSQRKGPYNTQTENTFHQEGNSPVTQSNGQSTRGSCMTTADKRLFPELVPPPQFQEGYRYVIEECWHTSIQRDSRQDEMNGIHKACVDPCTTGQVQAKGGSVKEGSNLCTGVTTNLGKLSELKNPMCVNLDLHKSPGEGVEPTRCLPLWILLLPAFLALVGYVLYYH